MHVNNSGRPIIHRVSNQIIHPGQSYDGPEVGPDGDYLHLKPSAPAAEGADPSELPSASALRGMKKADLAALAVSRNVTVPDDLDGITKDELIQAIELTR